jgi:hypothetical protein
MFIDLYPVTTQSFTWMLDGSGQPSVAAIPRFFSTPRLFFSTRRLYGVVVLTNCVILIMWALYNELRFHESTGASLTGQ